MANVKNEANATPALTMEQKRAKLVEMGIGNNTPKIGVLAKVGQFSGRQAARVVTGYDFAALSYEQEAMNQKILLQAARDAHDTKMYDMAVKAGLL